MNITFYWELQEGALEVSPNIDNLDNVVVAINYKRTGLDQDSGTQFSYIGQAACPHPSSDTFTLYDNLTKNDILGWLDLLVETGEIDNTITDELSKNKTILLPLPFEL